MDMTEMRATLETALAPNDAFKRGWSYARAIVALGPVEELEMARAIIDADGTLRAKVAEHDGKFDDIAYEIELRRKWASGSTDLVDQTLIRFRRVAERTKGVGHKVALLAFSEFCSCDVHYACQLLEEVIEAFEGADEVERRCGPYGDGQWPRNHYPSVLSAMAMFTQRPCWVLRHLFLPEIGESGVKSFDAVYFKRKRSGHTSP